MKNTLLFLTLLVSTFSFPQSVWHSMPDTPYNPSSGSSTPEAGDMQITDDGRIYTAFMWDFGSGLDLYIEEYIPGTGWYTLFTEPVLSGTQTIKSQVSGNSVYFVTKMGDGSGNPLCKVYQTTAGTVTTYANFQLPDFTESYGFDFEMGSDPNYGYLLYTNSSASSVNLGRIDYANNLLTSQTISIPGATSINTYDMTVAGDSVFMLISVQNPSYKLYLLKSGPAGTSILPYSSSAANGEVLNGGLSISSNTMFINSDGISKVFLSGYDFGNMAGTVKTYENGVLTPTTYIGTIPENNVLGSSLGTATTTVSFNNYSPSNSGPYKTYVLTRDLATDVYDTVGTPGNYVLSNITPTEHRLGYSEPKKRFVASFYDPTASKRAYLLSNLVPYINPSDIHAAPGICESQTSTIYNPIGISDDNGDPITIIAILSSDVSILDPGPNAYFNPEGQSGNVTNFSIYGQATQTGTVTLSLQVTDGWDTVVLQLPPVNVIAPTPPSFNTATIHMCSGLGDVPLSDYVSAAGGNFYINSLELDFPGGIYPTNNSPLTAEDLQSLSYDYFDGVCQYTITTDIVFHDAPSVNVTQTATACGQSTGTATALISGGATPYALTQWSSGPQNTTNVNNLGAGQYSFLVTDANTCSVTTFFDITSTTATATGTVTNVACHGESNGAIALSTSGLTAPITALWSSGHSTISLAQVPAGNYTVNLWDANGCAVTKTFTITEPDLLVSSASATFPTCQQADGSMQVDQTTGGTGAYSYAWSNGATGATASNIPFGIYSLTTTDGNNCTAINTLYVSEQGSADLYGSVTPTTCGGNDGAINVSPDAPFGETVTSILWSNGATTEDILNLAPATYTCTFVTSNNCTAVRGWDIPAVEPLRNDICVVTVDSATTTNLVVWERVQTTGIAYYKIYRESAVQGIFALIDTVQATNLSLFNDVVASPLTRSWRYKISAVNGCGIEGPLSAAHQTIHLDVLDNGSDVTINWNAYIGAAFSTYTVSRYTDLNGWEVVATVPATQLTYTDNMPYTTSGLDYMVEINLDQTCTAVVWRSQDFNSSRSNKDKGQFAAGNGTGDSNNGLDESYLSTVHVSPNPTNGLLNIVQTEARSVEIQVRSVDGQLMQTHTASLLHDQLDLGAYANGMYFITLRMNQSQQTLRIIKN